MAFPDSAWLGLAFEGAELAGRNYERQWITLRQTAPHTAVSREIAQWHTVMSHRWSYIDAVQLWDSPTGGALLWVDAIPTEPFQIRFWDAPRIPAGALQLSDAGGGAPFGRRRWGRGRYATLTTQTAIVTLELAFDAVDLCSDGTWEPVEPCTAADWAPVDLCTDGEWTAPPRPLRSVAA